METQPSPSAATAPPGSASGPGPKPRPSSSEFLSPVNNPQPNPATHYPNGLPRSINGLNGSNGSNGVNGSASTPPTTRVLDSSTPLPLSAPSTATSTATLTATTSSATSSAPALAPAPLKPITIYTPSMMSQPPKATPPQATPPHRHLQRQPSTGSAHKISIVDPPGAYSRGRNSPRAPQGFPSPKTEQYHLENPKYLDDLSRLTHGMQQAVPAAVRRVVRDNWEKCLLGSEFHHAFLLNAVIHHSNGVIVRRSIKDFGASMVTEAKHEIVEHFKSSDLDELARDIIEKASDHFLDQALDKRLRTIDARSLINALARAERLGYENSDILDEQSEEPSKFNPAPAQFNPAPNPISVEPHPRAQSKPSLPPGQQGRGLPPVLQCPLCWRKFENTQPYEYHVQKQVCTKEPPNKEGFPFSCKYCGAGFITKVGQQYHLANHVCGEHGTMPATPRASVNTGSPITLSSGNNSPIQPPASSLPRPSGSQQQFPAPSQYVATSVQPRASMSGPSGSQSKDNNPYAHLTTAALERLNEELRQAEITYTTRFKEAERIPDPATRQTKVDGLQNSFSTKQSIIRKKYGVRLRNRRTKAEIDNERQRMGWTHGSPSQSDGTPSAKRQRTDDGPLQNSQASGSNIPELKSHHLPVSDIQAGLGGSRATASMTDPTLPKPTPSQESVPASAPAPAQNSLSSFQRKGYRVSSHLPPSNQDSPTDTTLEGSTTHRNGSASAPLVVDDAEDSTDTDSDEEIPASLPPRRASGTPSRGPTG
ncbi:hypothetical protein F4677DRAFT_401536 [Hypoxylon crocopeplum]|nr:hypothetical protein F4677DRAFT_401536 [Hypoxylon crocopeplum]